ncbi:MAG: YoaP domain-containing protein [Candidatus Aminicenantes bacterium]|nr:YoaP domain-containing protein [Candidatus Aminicenantes bacterium]
MTHRRIVTVDAGNVDELGFFCVKNKKHPGYIAKRKWLERRFEEGMRINLIQTNDGQTAGFLETIPGEYTWRVVEAPGWLVIQCIWVASKKFPDKGMAPALIENCLKNAASGGKKGVAVVTSNGPWMAGKAFFLKNGFEQADEAGPYYQLLIKRTGKGKAPAFPKNWDERLGRDRSLRLIYTHQCPYIGKAVEELPPVADGFGADLNLIKLESAAEARERMPSPYGTLALIYNGRLLADHPISATRFKNILQRDLKLDEK